MTSFHEKIIKPKLGLLELAKQLESVSQACNVMGYSQGSEEALIDLSRKKPILKNRVPAVFRAPVGQDGEQADPVFLRWPCMHVVHVIVAQCAPSAPSEESVLQ